MRWQVNILVNHYFFLIQGVAQKIMPLVICFHMDSQWQLNIHQQSHRWPLKGKPVDSFLDPGFVLKFPTEVDGDCTRYFSSGDLGGHIPSQFQNAGTPIPTTPVGNYNSKSNLRNTV